MNDSVLAELIHGKGAHTDASAIVEGIGVETAGALPAGAPNSIFQVVWHINYWVDYELRRMAGESPAYPEHAAQSWPEDPAPGNAADWNATVERFKELLSAMTRLAKDGASLARPVPIVSTEHYANQGGTIGDVLIQTVVHNSYHLGQVAFLRRLLGAWPPPGGSDTW
jgi:uncharacterized damage-inducible protein DinB